MARIIAVVNQKGGVGKTTTSVNLAASLAVLEKPTLLVDSDPQANATSGLGVDKSAVETGIYDVLMNGVPLEEIITKTMLDLLSLAPSQRDLAGAEVEMAGMDGRENLLKPHLEALRDKYKYILIDCPPSLGLLTVNALTAADSVLIPIQAEYYALEGMGELLNTIDLIKGSLNPELDIEGILLTMYDPRLNLAQQVAAEIKKHFPDKMYNAYISRSVRLAEAPSHGKPIILYDVNSNGAQSYLALAREVALKSQ
jgi:chromosome partitioning protein